MPALIRVLSAVRHRLCPGAAAERGAVLFVVAGCLVAFLGMAALAIDLGSFEQAKTKAQSAADAGALAAADTLSGTNPPWASVGTSYASTNYPGATVNVSQPTSTSVKVIVSAATPEFFGRIWGKSSTNVSASAVATMTSAGGPNDAIFAKGDGTCANALSLEQGGLTLTGGIHSNGGIIASGHGNTYSAGTLGTTADGKTGCAYSDNSGGSNQFGSPTVTTPSAGTNQPWPKDYSSDFPTYPLTASGDPNCTSVGGDLNLQNNNPLLTYSNGVYTLPNGVYCYSTIDFNVEPIKCTCTFVAGSFQLNQGPDQWSPDFDGLMFYDVNDTSLNVNANGPSFLAGGAVFAPKASVTINAPSGTVSGFVEALNVTVNGGGPTTWTGTGPSAGSSTGSAALTQ